MTHPIAILDFLQQSPTPFHAVSQMRKQLLAAGFEALNEGERWQIQPQKKYLVTRNDSSLIAWTSGKNTPQEHGVRLVGAHTDSPCLKIKPQPDMLRFGYLQLGVEVYGGALLHPWFDRDLSIAGRVHYRQKNGVLATALVDFRHAVATIPSLAIHLDRDVNNGRAINAQKELPPLLLQVDDAVAATDFHNVLLAQLRLEQPNCDAECVLDYELSLYDTQAPALIGLRQQFIASARLDNLLSCFCGLQALLQANADQACVLACTDHEEVGSVSACGAQGAFLRAVLERWLGAGESLLMEGSPVENYERTIARSLLISADNAHGLHPNYSEKHDENHRPLLNGGPALKINANQRYASNSKTQALLRDLCLRHNIPLQNFVARSDMGCGSTIGPLTAAAVGVDTVDIGVPTFAMHSIRELAGVLDVAYLQKTLSAFFNRSTGDTP